LPPKKAALGQQGKAVGCVPPTALLFVQVVNTSAKNSQPHSLGAALALFAISGVEKLQNVMPITDSLPCSGNLDTTKGTPP
jgi:hypothetical protein